MDNDSTFDFLHILEGKETQKILSPLTQALLKEFYTSYLQAAFSCPKKNIDELFTSFLNLIEKQVSHPYTFSPYHTRIRSPFDYYQFGLDFLRPLVNLEQSKLFGKDNLHLICEQLKQKGNVIFFANHQIEADPQAISLLFEPEFSTLAEEMIFIAGDRVISDPLAVPFSLGRNLLCIYSKRYIDTPPELKGYKQQHNQKTMRVMRELLEQGGQCIYVAPSGGRDRRNGEGHIEIAPFDPQSIEMFYMMANQAPHPTFFYPMALGTYHILPPPETIQKELGEKRTTQRGPIYIAIGSLLDAEKHVGEETDKYVRRKSKANYIREMVRKNYSLFERDLSCF